MRMHFYVWGLDLSGSLQGAGGIGGLLSSYSSSTSRPAYFAVSDGNGNITDLVSTNGTSLAHYEFDPYGNTIVKSGSMAEANPFRFSSKYYDSETGLYYYGYRYYDPLTGRFINRDPTGIKGGRNLYGFVRNSAVIYLDALGKCTLTVVHVPQQGSFPAGIPDTTIAWFEAKFPSVTFGASNCRAPKVGDRLDVGPCSATIWTGGTFDPPDHEMNHYSCLETYERAVKSVAIDLGCVCKKDQCYQARRDWIIAQVNVATRQYDTCILGDDCADNGGGDLSQPSCKALVVTQAQLMLAQQAYMTAMRKVANACK